MLHKIFGGSPLAVLARLALLSLLVGVGMTWLDIDPWDVVLSAQRMAEHLWATGFVELRQLGHYLLAGAVVVVPIWIILRILGIRGPRAGPQPRWRPLVDGHVDPLRSEPRE